MKPFDGTKVVDSKIANAPVAPMPKILPQTHYAAARLLEEQGELAKAAVQYRKAIAVNHQFVAAYHRLGMLLSKQGQHEEAIQLFNTAVEMHSDEAILHNNLGFELMFVEQWAQAKDHFGRAIEINPKMTRAHVNMGLVLSKLGEFDEALESFSSVLPEADAYYNMGLMYRGQKQYDDAAKAFEHVLKCNPKFTAAQRQLAEIVGFRTSPEERLANNTVELVNPPELDLPENIDRVVQSNAALITIQDNPGNQNDGDVVAITLPATKDTPLSNDDTSGESKKEEWENVFDELASHYANVESETIENTYNHQRVGAARRDDGSVDLQKAEVELAVPMPRISKIAARQTQPVYPRQSDRAFLQNESISDDSDQEAVAMTGLSLDHSGNSSVSVNRPAVIPETLEWLSGKLSLVRNEIACLENDPKRVDEMNRAVSTTKQSTIQRSVLVKEKNTDTNSKPKVKRSKPITDAGIPRAKTLIELFHAEETRMPFEEFTGVFKYLFATADGVGEIPARNQDEMITDALRKLEHRDLEHLARAEQTQLAVITTSPQEDLNTWMIQEFGLSARWLLQPDHSQIAEQKSNQPRKSTHAQAGESNQDEKPTTIEQIIHSAKSLVMGMATP